MSDGLTEAYRDIKDYKREEISLFVQINDEEPFEVLTTEGKNIILKLDDKQELLLVDKISKKQIKMFCKKIEK